MGYLCPTQLFGKECDSMVRTSIPTDILLIIALLLQLIGLAFAVMIDSYLQKVQRKAMLMIVTLTCLLIFQNVVDYEMEFYAYMPFARTVIAIIGYSIRPIIIVLFFDIVGYIGRKRWMWLLVALNTMIHFTAFFQTYALSLTGTMPLSEVRLDIVVI